MNFVGHQLLVLGPPTCRQLAAQGDKVAALGWRLAAHEAPPADAHPNPAPTYLALCRIAFNIQLLVQKVEEWQARGPRLSSKQLAGLLAWPAAVIAAAPVMLPSAGHDAHGQLCMVVMTITIEHLHTLAARSGESGVHAAAQAEAHAQLPDLVRACACCRAAGHAW